MNRQLEELKAGSSLLSTNNSMWKTPLRGNSNEPNNLSNIIDSNYVCDAVHSAMFNPGDSVDYPVGI